MRLSISDIYMIVGILAFYILILLGVKKFHFVEKYKNLSRKEKGISMCLFLLLLLIVSVVITLDAHVSVPADGKIGMAIGDFFSKLYSDNNTMIILVKYVLLQMPTFIILIFAISGIADRCQLEILPIYYLALFVVVSRDSYKFAKSSWEEALLLMVFAVVLLGIADCLNNVFTTKKIIFLIMLIVIFSVVEVTSKSITLQSIRLCTVILIETIFMGVIVKYGQYLRKSLRKALKLIYIILVIYINFKFI